jgi:hypothetical protein
MIPVTCANAKLAIHKPVKKQHILNKCDREKCFGDNYRAL